MENTSNLPLVEKSPRTGAKARKTAALAVRYIINTVLGILFISPLLWMFVTAFNPVQALGSQITSITEFLPKTLSLNNFKAVFTRIPMVRYLLNTLLYALGTVVLVLIVNSLAGYALAKIPFRGRGAVVMFIVIMLTIPFEGITLSLYMVVSKLQLLNTPFAVILPSAMSCFYIFMFRQFFTGIPNAVIEAAEIDGCKPLTVFFRIVLPMAMPVFVTVFILEFFGKWSDYYWPMLTLTNSDLWNIQIAIADFNSRAEHYGQFMAALTVCTLPIVILFLFLQKYYIQGIATQGIKDM
ncbi:MAG: carbohydrate ABC transporter permease [Clostridia bacterium]|jgi:multiple sugar transport system permease protein/fructooligosaccharide transport system permease protein|nr:carbohydrate ABC transporter permease [Clostridia bacterium]